MTNRSRRWRSDGGADAGGLPASLWILDPSGPVPYRQILTLLPAAYVRGLAWTRDGAGLTVGVVTRSGDIVLAERAR